MKLMTALAVKHYMYENYSKLLYIINAYYDYDKGYDTDSDSDNDNDTGDR